MKIPYDCITEEDLIYTKARYQIGDKILSKTIDGISVNKVIVAKYDNFCLVDEGFGKKEAILWVDLTSKS